MKPQDQALANIAEAAKRVMNKETEVQPSDKDFVDLHSIDKQKRRGSTPLTEKDIDEANEFTKAAAKAAVAGDDEFEFDGKKFPTEMDVDVAKKILGESTDLGEAFIDVDTADPKSIEFAKLMKKYRVKGRIITMKGPGGGMPLVRLTGKKKDLEGILKDPMGWQDDGFLAGFIEESLNFDEESEIDESDDFEPHWMYDPETGEKERAEKPEDHERLKALGWAHEPPVKESKIDNYVGALAKKYNGLKTIDPNSKDWKDLVKQLSNLSDADLKKVVDAKIKWASMMAEPMLKYGKHASKRHGGSLNTK